MWGVADLPLHDGHVPPWLYNVMKRIAKAVIKLVVAEFGQSRLLRRLANPLWFQAFNNVIGMDWDSSGSTTVTTAVVREVLLEENLGVWAVGGKGARSLRVPEEIASLIEASVINSGTGEILVKVSKLTAKTDSALLQDGFGLYHHVLLFNERGEWVVVQQGMNVEERLARRYHISWERASPSDITLDPHTGALCEKVVEPLNLTSRASVRSRKTILDLVRERSSRVLSYARIVNAAIKGSRPLVGDLPRPIRRELIYYKPVRLDSRILSILNEAYEVHPSSFPELLLKTRVGPETLRALSLISEIVYREPPPLEDIEIYSPFKYAYAIGGKDGVPYPVRRELAEEVLRELYEIVKAAELGHRDKIRAFKALSKLAPPDVLPI